MGINVVTPRKTERSKMSDLDTQVMDDPVIDPSQSDDGDGGGGDEPFLKVNDRQVFKTREDAIKSYEEASKMGVSFGELRKVAKEFGITDLNPGLVRQLFSELVQHRTKAATPAKPSEPTAPKANGKTVDPEVQKAIEWLKEHAGEAGYVSKEEAEALKKELAELKNGFSAKDEEARDALITEGQEAVSGWLADAKGADGKPVTLNEDERQELEETIAAWINAKEERVARFYKGGNTSLSLVKEGFTKALPIIKPGATAFPNPATRITASGKTKTELMRRNPSRLPNDGGTPKTDAKKMKFGSPDLFNSAKSRLARMLAEGGDE